MKETEENEEMQPKISKHVPLYMITVYDKCGFVQCGQSG